MSIRHLAAVSAGVATVAAGGTVAIVLPAQQAGANTIDNGNDVQFGPGWGSWSFTNPTQFRMESTDNRYTLLFQDNGNWVERDTAEGNRVIWQTSTIGTGHKLDFQSDGNVVIYDASGAAVWQNGGYKGTTSSFDNFIVQTDGNVVEYNSNLTPIWQSGTSGQ